MAKIVQQVIDTPDQPLQLGFAQQDYRSLTAALPIELYKVVYEQANRNAESDSQYISRMLEQALPSEIHELVNNLITELRKWSIAPVNDTGQGDPSPDDLTDFLTNHAESTVIEVKDKSPIQNSASGHDQNQSNEVTESHN